MRPLFLKEQNLAHDKEDSNKWCNFMMEVEQQQRLVTIRILKETYNEACRGRRWKTTSRDQKLAYLPLVLDLLTESNESSIVMMREQA